MNVRASVAGAVIALASLPAHADDRSTSGQLALTLDGVESGFVRAISSGEGSKKTLLVATEQPSAPMLASVRAFLDGKATKQKIVLSTPAVIQKATDARLVDVRLPSYAGGTTDLVLGFEIGSLSNSPSLRTGNDRTRPRGVELAGFRLAIGDLPATDASRLDAITLKGREGAAIPGAFSFDVPSREAPAWLAWSKKAAPRDASIEYVSKMGETVLGVKLGGCVASSAKIDGPVTHVVVTCSRARSG
jgi:hypothetical protein